MPDFLSYVLPSMVGMLIVGSTVSWIPFLSAGVQENSGLLRWRYMAAGDDVRCGRRHAGNRCGNYYRPVERQQRLNLRLARLSLRQHAGLAVLFSLLMMTHRQMFLTDARLFGATDELMPGAVRYSRIDIRQSGLYAGNRRAGGNP